MYEAQDVLVARYFEGLRRDIQENLSTIQIRTIEEAY